MKAAEVPPNLTGNVPASLPGRLLAGIAGWTLVGTAIGCGAGFFTVAQNGSILSIRDGLVFQLLTSLTYGGLFLGAGLCAACALAFSALAGTSARATFRVHCLISALSFAGFAALNFALSNATPWGLETDRRSVVAGFIGAFAVPLVAAVALRPFPALAARAGWLIARCALGALFAFPLLSIGQAPEGGGLHAPAPERPPERSIGERRTAPGPVVLLGLDGADWNRIRPLMKEGKLPSLAEFCERAVTAPLKTLVPTWSPVVWTSIATGQDPERHGILDFTEIALPLIRRPVQRLRVLERIALHPLETGPPVTPYVGLAPMIELLVSRGILNEAPIGASSRRVKALWNILSEQGLRVGVVRYWATWPAERVEGFLLADHQPRSFARLAREAGLEAAIRASLTSPPEWIGEIANLEGDLLRPERFFDEENLEAGIEAAFELPMLEGLGEDLRPALRSDWRALKLLQNVYEEDCFAVAVAEELLRERSVDWLAVYLQTIDAVSHRIESHVKRDTRYLAIVDESYAAVDALIGTLLEDESLTVVLVSDHGWSYDPRRYGHYDAPDGVLAAAGPWLRRGVELSEKPGVLDVAPTLLALLGLPASKEMPGHVLREAMTEEAASVAALSEDDSRVDSYGGHRLQLAQPLEGSALEQASSELMQVLRELGYVE